MTLIQPFVWAPMPEAVTCGNRMWERSRIEWRLGEPGDPADIAQAFLAAHGLGRPGFDPRPEDLRSKSHDHHEICGAALLVSAAAGAAMVGGPTGRPSPATSVPDLAVVVYGHGPRPVEAEPLAHGDWRLGQWRPSWTAS